MIKRLSLTIGLLFAASSWGAQFTIDDITAKTAPDSTDLIELQEQGVGSCSGGLDCSKSMSLSNLFTRTPVDVGLKNDQCVNWLDFGGASIDIFCLDTNDDLNIGDAVAVDNININFIAAGLLTITGATTIINADATPALALNQDGDGISLNVDSEATTADIINIDGNTLTIGSLLRLFNLISADGLTNRGTSDNLFTLAVSRTETRTSGTTVDDFDLMNLVRTSVTSGAGGTMTAAGSVLALANVVTETDGTLTDTVSVLEVLQDTDSIGDAIRLLINGNSKAINIVTTANTTTNIFDIPSADSLTDGFIFNFVSNSADTSTRTLGFLHNDNTLAVNATVLTLKQDADADALHIEGGNVLFSAAGSGLYYGAMYVPSSFTVPIGDANPTEVDDGTATFDGWAAGQLNGITFPAGGTEHYVTVTQPGIYEICWSLSTFRAGGSSLDTHAGVMIDDVAIREIGEAHRTLGNNDSGTFSTCSFHDLPSGDEEVSLWVIMSDGAEDAMVDHGNMTVTLIGGT